MSSPRGNCEPDVSTALLGRSPTKQTAASKTQSLRTAAEADAASSNASTPSPTMTETSPVEGAPPLARRTSSDIVGKSVRMAVTNRPSSSFVRKEVTVVAFKPIRGRERQARALLLLCNISDRELDYRIKCNGDMESFPSGAGTIPARSQVRLVLTRQLPSTFNTWKKVPSVKMLLITRFHQAIGKQDETVHTTAIRLKGIVNHRSLCDRAQPPVEQFLFDAAGKEQSERNLVTAVSATPATTTTAVASTPPKDATSAKKAASVRDSAIFNYLKLHPHDRNMLWFLLAVLAVILVLRLTTRHPPPPQHYY